MTINHEPKSVAFESLIVGRKLEGGKIKFRTKKKQNKTTDVGF